MLTHSSELLFFTAKIFIITVFILLLISGMIALLTRNKEKQNGKIFIKNLNKKYAETTETLLETILPKKKFKAFIKNKKKEEKASSEYPSKKNIFVLHFHGDIKGTAVSTLREEVTAVLGIANSQDEVVVCLESGGGMVHSYGLGAAQLQRIRNQSIHLTVIVDKIAASGGYLMASVANKILAAPFAVIGSIGVIVQLPNFHRLLKEKKIDFEQLTAGSFKRTITLFGQNTEEGREKLQEEIEEIHDYFKQVIQQYRPQINIDKVATGEHWLGSQALELNLVDQVTTSDDYLFSQNKTANIYELGYQTKKSLAQRLMMSIDGVKNSVLLP